MDLCFAHLSVEECRAMFRKIEILSDQACQEALNSGNRIAADFFLEKLLEAAHQAKFYDGCRCCGRSSRQMTSVERQG